MKVFKSIVFLFIIYNSYAKYNFCRELYGNKIHYKSLKFQFGNPQEHITEGKLEIDHNINHLIDETEYSYYVPFHLYFKQQPIEGVFNSDKVKIVLLSCEDIMDKSKLLFDINEKRYVFFIISIRFKH